MPNHNTAHFLGLGLSEAAQKQLDFSRAADREEAPEALEIYEKSDAVLRASLQHMREFRAQFANLPAEHPLAMVLDAAITRRISELSYTAIPTRRRPGWLGGRNIHGGGRMTREQLDAALTGLEVRGGIRR